MGGRQRTSNQTAGLEKPKKTEAKPVSVSKIRTAILAGVIILSGIAAYSNTFNVPFLMDDVMCTVDNRTIHHLGDIGQVLSPPSDDRTVHGRPILNFTLAISYAISKDNVTGYHVFNLAIHIIAALALMGIIRRTMLLERFGGRFDRVADLLGIGVAMVWMLHPMQTGGVTYIIQRAESQMGMFYMLTMYCAIRSMTSVSGGRWAIAATLLCALGMGSKEVMFSAPLMAILYDRIFVGRSWQEVFRLRWKLYAGLFSTWLVLGGLMAGKGRRSCAYLMLSGLTSSFRSRPPRIAETAIVTRYSRAVRRPITFQIMAIVAALVAGPVTRNAKAAPGDSPP